jgi:hypothetical protein
MPAEALVLIELPNIAKIDSEIAQEVAATASAMAKTPIGVISPDPLSLIVVGTLAFDEEKGSEASVDSGSGAEFARLFGIYSGQIQARVERVWRRPRTPVNEGSDLAKSANSVEYFRCQVQIVQDSNGGVQEIQLPSCNGSVAWQRSLVLAIQHSSPLPVPPSPAVFGHTISLNFTGYAYITGSSDDEYETFPPASQAEMPIVNSTQFVSDALLYGPVNQTPSPAPSSVTSDRP